MVGHGTLTPRMWFRIPPPPPYMILEDNFQWSRNVTRLHLYFCYLVKEYSHIISYYIILLFYEFVISHEPLDIVMYIL